MRKLSDQRKAIIAFSVIAGLLIITLIAGIIQRTHEEMNTAQGKTLLVKSGSGKVDGICYTIVTDTETKIQYILTDAGLFPLYNADGSLKAQ